MIVTLTMLVGAGVFIVAPGESFAQSEPCQCWCKGSFAFPIEGSYDSNQACSDACTTQEFTASGQQVTTALFLGCYQADEADLQPTNDSRCWTQSECQNDQVEVSPGDFRSSVYGGQASACPKGEGFCYNPTTPVTLNVALGDVQQAGTIGEYVAAAYRWLIPAAALLAIVMIMIGGLQYALARGRPAAIDKAKQRIGNAVLGLVLLLSAYMIASLIDPSLVAFNTVQPPKIKTVTFIDPNSTCNALHSLGFDIGPSAGSRTTIDPNVDEVECGDKGYIISLDNLDSSVGESSLELGHECVWNGCDYPETCVASEASESGFTCQRCSDSWSSVTGAAGEGVSPSPSVCGQLQAEDDPNGDGFGGIYPYCSYSAGFTIGNVNLSGTCYELVYPETSEATGVDCELLRSNSVADAALNFTASCRSYDLVQARYGDLLVGHLFNEADDIESDPNLLGLVCEADPCGFGLAAGGCQMVDFEELLALHAGLDCDNVTFPVSTICGEINAWIAQVGCFDAEAANLITANTQAYGTLIDSVTNAATPEEVSLSDFLPWNAATNLGDLVVSGADAISTYVQNVDVASCTDANGNTSVLNCALTY